MAVVVIFYDGDEIRAKLVDIESGEGFEKAEHGLEDNILISVIDGVDAENYTVYIDGQAVAFSGED